MDAVDLRMITLPNNKRSLYKKHEKLYKIDCLFVVNKQDMKEISSFLRPLMLYSVGW